MDVAGQAVELGDDQHRAPRPAVGQRRGKLGPVLLAIAVGTRVAPRPPHRSGRAQFRYSAPTSRVWRRTADLARDDNQQRVSALISITLC